MTYSGEGVLSRWFVDILTRYVVEIFGDYPRGFLPQFRLETAQVFQCPLARLFLFMGTQCRGQWPEGSWGRLRGAQAHPANLEVLFEAVGLEEVGEFEGADIAAPGPDFALQIADDLAQVRQ